jgi:hypothetical protein
MKRAITPMMFLLFVFVNPVVAEIPESLILSGQGEVRYLGFIKVYDAFLYAPPGAAANDILSENCSRCLKLEYNVRLTVDNFIEAADKVLLRQHDRATLDLIRPQLEQLNNAYRDVEKDDRYLLCYDAANQFTELLLNGKRLAAIPSAAFASVYFGIWLGIEKPIDQTLRTQLLAGLK